MVSILNNLIAPNESLKEHIWTPREVRLIPTEALARFAFQSSDTLRTEYLSEELFVSHWAGQRQRFGLAAQSGPDTTGPLDELHLKREWETSSALREEFNNSFSSYLAFLRADRRGGVRIAGRRQA